MGKLIRNGIEFGGAAEQASRISYDNSDSIIHATNLQGAIDELAGGSQSLFVPTVRTINGLDLTEDRVLKSAQFAESVTGEKMLANLLYSQVNSWDSGASKSIKLESDAYLDARGVEMNSTTASTRRTLQDWGATFYGFNAIYKEPGTSATFTLSNGGRAIIFTDSLQNALKNMYIVSVSSSGTASYKSVFEQSTQVPITTGSGTFTFTNNTSSGGHFCALTFSGDSSWS